jgi:acetyl esterase/lipase
MGSKQADMHDLSHTLQALMKNGYAIVAINYRYSTTAIFPAQIQDCNQAMEFVYENAGKYQLDTAHIALMGFSAGGHLAALMGLSANNSVPDFYIDGKKAGFRISAVVDYYGLSDFYLRPQAEHNNSTSGPGLLFGAAMVDKPALVKQATPLTYIDGDDPPFLIIHGNKDELMDVRQSIRLDSALRSQGVVSQLMLIDGAPHGGELFDTKSIRSAVISFLNAHLK